MHVKYLQCVSCKKRYDKARMKYECECGSSLDIVYDYSRLKKTVSWRKLRKRPFNHWRYKEFYPKVDDIVTMNEGGTPIIQSRANKNIIFKMEGLNPTGSFKDRGSTLEISKALEAEPRHVVCASTGNMGASVAAYCSRAGLKARIFVPRDAVKEKIMQMHRFGAEIRKVNGDYTKAAETAFKQYEIQHHYLVGDYSYRGEGEKSVGYEILDQVDGVNHIFCPVGNGTMLSSIWKAMKEFKKAGLVKKLPKMVAVQAAGCNTVVRSFEENSEIVPVRPKTVATAIACGDPIDGKKAVDALKESKGFGIIVTDKEILHARRAMARLEGIDAEASGAVAFAGMIKINIQGKNVIIVSGSGLKDTANY